MNETLVTIGLCATVAGSAVAAQPQLVDPCTTRTITCPSPSSTNYFVSINLEPDSSSVCRFNPRQIDDLKIDVGAGVSWSFCNACSKNMDVEFTTLGTGPFHNFQIFLPPPTADNLVTVQVGCKDYGSASGINAVTSGDWKYSLKARPTGTVAFPDEIDPRLEIDDRTFALWAVRGGLLLLGLGLGFVGARLFTGKPSTRPAGDRKQAAG